MIYAPAIFGEKLKSASAIFDSLNEGLITLSSDLKVYSVNKHFQKFFSDLIGQDHNVKFESIVDAIDTRKRLVKDAQCVLNTGETRTRESVGSRTGPLLNTIVPLSDEDGNTVGILIRSKSNEEAVATRNRLEKVQEITRTVWWEWDIQNDRLEIYAPKNCILGIDTVDFIPHVRYWEEKVHPDDLEAYRSTLNACLTGKSKEWTLEHRYCDIKSGWNWISTKGYITSWSSDGTPIQMLGTTVNIDERKKYEIELIESRKAETYTRKSLEAANQAKDTFLATISHELRTPLNPIIGFTQLILESGKLDLEEQELLDIVHDRSHDLLRLIDDILDITQIETNCVKIEPSEVRLNTVMDAVYDDYKVRARDKGLKFIVDTSKALHEAYLLDRLRVKQILNNLIDNAIKYTANGSVTVQAELLNDNPKNSAEIRFTICDTGIGIPDSNKNTVFQQFRQLDSSNTREYGGLGLGLTICKRLAILMNGDIKIRDNSGKGSVFEFILPAKKAGAGSFTVSDENGKSRAPELAALIVEDDLDNALLLSTVLSKLGFEAQHARNGIEAIKECETTTYDLILMDIKMPEMDGISATRILRRKNILTPIIGCSAHAFDNDKKKSIDAGMDFYLTKPIRRDALEAAIKSTLPHLC